jgi:hypothetical protein
MASSFFSNRCPCRSTRMSESPSTRDLEREAWLRLSEQSLKEVWDNEADDVFNDLLEK